MSEVSRKVVALLTIAGAAALLGAASAPADSGGASLSFCEKDECRHLMWCHDSRTWPVGCDMLPGSSFCETYACSDM